MTTSKTITDIELEIQCVRRERDEALYYDAPEYVIDRISHRLDVLEHNHKSFRHGELEHA